MKWREKEGDEYIDLPDALLAATVDERRAYIEKGRLRREEVRNLKKASEKGTLSNAEVRDLLLRVIALLESD